MAINAGTIMAWLDLDTSGFGNALQLAQSQATAFARDGGGISDMLNGVGAAATTIGRTLTMGVTTPLVGLGVSAVKTGMDFDAQMSRVQAISGASAEEFATLRAAAIQMGADSVFGATDAAQALEYMGMAGWKTDQMIAGLPGIINLAAASGENLGTVSDIVTDALTAFGLQASDSAHFADVLAAASSNSNTNVGMMGETFKYVAPLAGSLSYSVEDTALAIGLMANAGIKGGQAGTALRGMLTRLSKPTDEVATAMEKYNISLTDAHGNMLPFGDVIGNLRGVFAGLTEAQKVELAATLAGQEGMSGLLAIVNASEEDYNKLAGAITNSAGAAETMAAKMLDNLKGDFEGLSGALEGVALAFSDYITPAIRTVVKGLTKAVDWFNGLSDGAKNAAFKVAGIAAAIGPVLMIGGKLLSAFSPVVPLVAAVGGGLALIYKHSERVRGIVDKLRTGGPAAFDGLKAGVSQYSELMAGGASHTEALGKALEAAFGAKASGQITGAIGKLASGFGRVKSAVGGALNGVGEFVGSLIDGQSVAQSLEDALQAAFGGRVPESVRALQAGIGGLVTQIKDDFAVGGVLGVLRGLGGTIADGLQSGVAAAKSKLSELWPTVLEGLTNAREWIAPKAQALMTSLGTALASAKDYAVEHLPAVRDAIMNGLGVAKDKMTGVAKNAMTWLGNAYRSGSVQKALGNLAGVGKTVLGKLSAGKDALWDKAGEMLGWLGEALGSSDVLDKLGELSGVAAGIAGKIASGMGSWRGTASELIGGLVTQLTDNGFLQTALEGLGAVAVAIGEGICTTAVNMADAAATLLSQLAQSLTQPGLLDGLLTDASTIVVGVGNAIISAAGKIIPAATTLISTLVNKLSESGFVTTLFTTAGTVVTEIGGQIADAAPKIVGCATALVTSLVNKLGETDFVSNLFTNAATVVVEIAKAIGDNAGSIIDAAGKLAIGLLDGLAEVDWLTVGTALGDACSKLVTAIADWFMVPGNAKKLWDVGWQIAKDLLLGFVEGISPNTIYLDPEIVVHPDFSAPEGYEIDQAIEQTAAERYETLQGFASMFSDGGEVWAASLNKGFQQGLDTLDTQQALSAAAMLMASGFGESVRGVAPELAATVSEMLGGIESAATTGEVKAGFAAVGYQITDELANAIFMGRTDVSLAIGALGAGLNSDMILSMDQLTLREFLLNYFSQTGTDVSGLLKTSATDWGEIFGYAIPDGATVGLENGMYLLRAATGEVLKEVSAVDAEATVKAGNKAMTEGGMEGATEGINENKDGPTTAMDGAVGEITAPMETMPDTGKTNTDDLMTAVKLAIEEGTPAATAAITVAAQAVVDTASGIMSEGSGKGIGRDYITAIGSGIGSMRVQLTYKARELAQAGVGAVSAVMSWSAGYSIGTQMVSSIVSGVGAMASALNAKMRTLALGAVAAFRAALQMHSPSRVLVADGMMIPTSIGLGVERNADEATRSMIDLARDMADAWPDGPDGWDVDGFGGGHGGGAGGQGGQGGLVVNNNGPITIREEADIERVAGVLYEMYLEEIRGG